MSAIKKPSLTETIGIWPHKYRIGCRVGLTCLLPIVGLIAPNFSKPVQAASAYCSILYAIDNTGTTFSKIYNVDVTSAVYSGATANSGAAATNTAFLSAAAAIEPSTGRIFYVSRDISGTRVGYWNPVTNTQTQLSTTFTSSTTVIRAAFSSSGRLFAATSTVLFELNPVTGALMSSKALSGVNGANGDMAFDGNNVLFLAADANLYTIDIDNLSASSPANPLGTAPAGTTFNSLGFKTDGKLYAHAGSNSTVYEVNTNTGGITPINTVTFNPTTTAGVVGTDFASCAEPTPTLVSEKTYTKFSGSIGSTFLPGDVLEYTVTTTNTGLVPATKATFQDPVPAGTSYVVGSTTMNSVAVTDVAGPTFPFATSATINSLGLKPGVVGFGATYKVVIKYKVKINTVSPPTSVTNQGTTFYLGGPTVGIPSDDPNTPAPTDPTITTVTPLPVTLSGTVFNDTNGDKLKNGTEAFTNGGGLNSVLVNSSNLVVATTTVAANGTYTFNNAPANATYTVQITTATATVGSAPPAIVLPLNYVTTGENLNGTVENTPDSQQTIIVAATSITNVNFGIEQLPTSVGGTASSQVNPGTNLSVQVPINLFNTSTDPDTGTVTQYRITAFPTNITSIEIDGVTYTSTTQTGTTAFPGVGVTVLATNLNTIKVDPVDGAVSVIIPFKAIDNAGKESANTANAIVPFTASVVTLPPELILLKRITKINSLTIGKKADGTPIDLTLVVAQPDNAATSRDESNDATNPNWVVNYPKGAIDGGVIQSGDLVEYTIYFLSAGGKPVTNANFCDWVPKNTAFVPDTYGLGRGIQLAIGSIVKTFTNVPDGDRGVFYNPGAIPPVTYPDANTFKLNCMSPAGIEGAVVVNLVNTALLAPNDQLPNATAAGTPGNSYGFVRFVSKVK